MTKLKFLGNEVRNSTHLKLADQGSANKDTSSDRSSFPSLFPMVTRTIDFDTLESEVRTRNRLEPYRGDSSGHESTYRVPVYLLNTLFIYCI